MLNKQATRRNVLKAASAGLAVPVLGAGVAAPRAVAQDREQIRFASWLGAATGLADLYNESQDAYEVSFEEIPFDQYADTLLIDMASGTAPDIFHWPGPWWIPSMELGVFQPLDEYFTRDGIDLTNFVFQPSRVAEMDGQLYGLPYALPTTRIIIYNKRIFAEAGVEEPTADWTWDDLVAKAQELHNPPDVYGIPFPPHPLNLESMILSNGGGIISEDGTDCLLDEPASVEAVQASIDWYSKFGFTMEPGQEESLGDDPFASDKLAMAYISIPGWESWQRYTRDLTIDAGVVMFPVSPETEVRRTSAETHMMAIPSSTDKTEAAWEFMKWSQTSEEAMQYWIAFYPVNWKFEEYIQLVPEGLEREITSLRRNYMETMEVVNWGPSTTEGRRAFQSEYELAVLGEKPTEDAMAAACEAIDDLLAEG